MKARYQYRIHPTDQQRLKLAKLFGCCRVVWNDALAIIKATAAGEKWPSHADLQKVCIPQAKQAEGREWLAEVNNIPLQQSIQDLGVAFKNCFDDRKGKRKGPRVGCALAKAISRAGWRQIRALWEAKADMIHDREVRIISRWEATSQGCSCCGYRWGKLDLPIRSVVCLNCGTVHDRDVNASVNIVAAGQAVPNGQTLSRVRPQSGAVAGLSTHQEAI